MTLTKSFQLVELRSLKNQECEINHNNHHHHKHHNSQDNVSSGSKSDPDDYKCFVCKTGLKSDDKSYSKNFFQGQNLYFHQGCASVMSRIGQKNSLNFLQTIQKCQIEQTI
uniref:Uncharacterized protein n=1 Tax=Megaselia scalaris TaxID=36166 RepID=T1GUY4_MEGSC